jgi:hypothetical protein
MGSKKLMVTSPNTCQKKKGYFFIRRLAANPPKPNTIPITIMLGSGTTASEL